MIQDAAFYALAVPAFLVLGISKGGFGMGIGAIALTMLRTKGILHGYLSEYFQSGYMNFQALNEWIAMGEASRPAAVVDERVFKPTRLPEAS